VQLRVRRSNVRFSPLSIYANHAFAIDHIHLCRLEKLGGLQRQVCYSFHHLICDSGLYIYVPENSRCNVGLYLYASSKIPQTLPRLLGWVLRTGSLPLSLALSESASGGLADVFKIVGSISHLITLSLRMRGLSCKAYLCHALRRPDSLDLEPLALHFPFIPINPFLR
jgi:hypothetical protein